MKLPLHIGNLLENYCGINYEALGQASITSIVNNRKQECSLPSDDAYFEYLSKNSSELDAFVEALLVPETWFFRDTNPFLHLSAFSKNFLKNKAFLRILSIACATGEETYSIAMTLLDAGWTPDNFCVYGIDIGQKFLDIAGKGIYSEKSFSPQDYCERSKYFDQIDDDLYSVKDHVRNAVRFIKGNIIDPKLFNEEPQFNAIFARNVLIYLTTNARKKALANISHLLLPDGQLFLGHADDISLLSEEFKPTGSPSAFVFARSLPVQKKFKPATPKKHIGKKASPHALSEQVVLNSELLAKAQELGNQGLFEEAEKYCNKDIKINGSSADAYFLMGQIFAAQNKLDLAEEAYKKAIYLDNNHINSLFQLELLYIGKSDLKQAKILHDHLIRVENNK